MSMEPVFETTYCNYCGSNEVYPLFTGKDRLLHLPGTFRVVKCKNCGLLRQDPRPTRESIEFYYPSNYEPFSTAIDMEKSLTRRWDRRYGMLKRIREIERLSSKGRVLDVGCATGNFLFEMARYGHWDVEGVEPNREAAQYAINHFGLSIHIGELTAVDLPQKTFDVITMWNVFEHLYDPMENLRVIANLLKPKGWFIFSIPNLSCFERRLFGKYWMGWELPRHIYYPTQIQMGEMLDRFGLKIRKWKCITGAYPSFLLSLRFWLEGIGIHSSITGSLLRMSESLTIRMLTAPLFWVITQTKRASIITGFARLESW